MVAQKELLPKIRNQDTRRIQLELKEVFLTGNPTHDLEAITNAAPRGARAWDISNTNSLNPQERYFNDSTQNMSGRIWIAYFGAISTSSEYS